MFSKRIIMLIAAILASLAALWFVFSSGLTKAPPDTELEKFQGRWEFVSMEVEGKKKPDEEFKKYTVVFKDDQWNVLEGMNTKAQTTFEVDPGANPKTIDLFPLDGRILQGIYRLEGDRLTMCDRDMEKGDRPTEFATKPDSGLVLVVLRKVNR